MIIKLFLNIHPSIWAALTEAVPWACGSFAVVFVFLISYYALKKRST
jgi:hypothetical protein